MSENLSIRPYARLITMLGDQLIKNESIALVEIIKNSYDADASWVKVSFENFSEDFTATDKSKIIIEDDGCGMDERIIKQHWLNPATPEKLKRKKEVERTQKGRVIQGEKGIGRFAVFKLGSVIKITTRRQKVVNGEFVQQGEEKESIVVYDFSRYDSNFLTKDGKEEEIFLDDLQVSFEQRVPQTITESPVLLGTAKRARNGYGTVIEVSNLKTSWSSVKIGRIQNEIGKLTPIFSNIENYDFNVWFNVNGKPPTAENRYKEKLINLLENKSVFKISAGHYFSEKNQISFLLNKKEINLDFSNPDITGLLQFKKYFKDSHYVTECGDFSFEFFVFDLNANSENPSKYYLDEAERKIIKDHRVYLYRDNVRVMPYGNPDDDWLGVDIARGTIRATEFLSNDQVVGYVSITQKNNPKLIDKTNREGLIEEGNALEDLINILQLILRYIRKKPYAQYLLEKKKKLEINQIKQGRPLEIIKNAQEQFGDKEDVLSFLRDFQAKYLQERAYFYDRATKTENLAAVGLSVETASHDVMLFIKKSLESLDELIKEIALGDEVDFEQLQSRLISIRGSISIVETQMKDIQLLFPSTKSKTKNVNIQEIITKVENLYSRSFKDNHINVSYSVTSRPLIVRTTDAVLLQVFINLFDNSLYWIKTIKSTGEIHITIDGNEQRLIFSDDGPGIREEDISYIFEPFYSGKGEDGRGLGLYIARQLLDRYDYSINIAEFSKDMVLPGANFVLEFVKEG